MFEIVVLLIGAFPFLVGLYAIKMMRHDDDDGDDDQPPPPDPGPPQPVVPRTPRRRRPPHTPLFDRRPVSHRRIRMPETPSRVRR